MADDIEHRRFKTSLYGHFARVGKALANPVRLEFLELLAQAERTVDSLATETGQSLANASQHLIALKEAGLVVSQKSGLFVHYRLADDSVLDLTRALRVVAERRFGDLDRLVHDHFGDRDNVEAVSMDELLERTLSGDVVVLDARPEHEYEAGHIEGAISMPYDVLETRLRELPKGKRYVAYCRGPYCVYADRAVETLRTNGRRAKRMLEGYPEWKAAGLPIALSAREEVSR